VDTIQEEAGRKPDSQAGKHEAEGSRPVQKRGQYSKAYKRQVVEEALTGEESVSVVARRHDINANMLFNWRKQYLAGKYEEESGSGLIPITVSALAGVPSTTPDTDHSEIRSGVDRLEIVLSGGHRLVVEGSASSAALRTALEVLKA